jgi:hypothetical protein
MMVFTRYSARALSLKGTSTIYHMTMSLFNCPVLMTNWVTSSTPNWFQPARRCHLQMAHRPRRARRSPPSAAITLGVYELVLSFLGVSSYNSSMGIAAKGPALVGSDASSVWTSLKDPAWTHTTRFFNPGRPALSHTRLQLDSGH